MTQTSGFNDTTSPLIDGSRKENANFVKHSEFSIRGKVDAVNDLFGTTTVTPRVKSSLLGTSARQKLLQYKLAAQ